MRLPPGGILVLGAVLGTSPARADTIDDLVLTGNGRTLSFPLPATTSAVIYPHLDTVFEGATATLDGVGGYSIGVTFYVSLFTAVRGGADFSVGPNAPANASAQLNGAFLLAAAGSTTPGIENFVLVPGTYSLSETLQYTPGPVPYNTPYMLTITPEASPVPEPEALVLAGTGVMGWLFGMVRRVRVNR